MNFTNLIVGYEGEDILRISATTPKGNNYAFYYSKSNKNIWCNCSDYETEHNKKEVLKAVKKHLNK